MLAVLDPRLRTMGYGRRFLASLPPAPVTHDLDAIERFFDPRSASGRTWLRRRRRASSVRPILKWAGGKRQLLPALRPFYPRRFDRYVEPFVGSGAVFLDLLQPRACWRDVEVRLSDINADVIGCYRAVRDAAEDVIAALRQLEARLPGRRARRTSTRSATSASIPRAASVPRGRPARRRYTPALAAMLIYLNRTGYNGLFRVNARGEFNVPAGRYASLRICDADNLRVLATAPAATRCCRSTCGRSTRRWPTRGTGDFVYLDPPYAPLSRTAHFTSYTAGGFGPSSRRRCSGR